MIPGQIKGLSRDTHTSLHGCQLFYKMAFSYLYMMKCFVMPRNQSNMIKNCLIQACKSYKDVPEQPNILNKA
jgi:hypothetical protein